MSRPKIYKFQYVLNFPVSIVYLDIGVGHSADTVEPELLQTCKDENLSKGMTCVGVFEIVKA